MRRKHEESNMDCRRAGDRLDCLCDGSRPMALLENPQHVAPNVARIDPSREREQALPQHVRIAVRNVLLDLAMRALPKRKGARQQVSSFVCECQNTAATVHRI